MILMLSHPAAHPALGDFMTPQRWSQVPTTPIWAADNGAFKDFDPDAFRRMLDNIAGARVRPRFVSVPDVVGNHAATSELWVQWAREFRVRNIPRAFVLQNGIEELPPQQALPWSNLDAIFIGGDTAFKFSPWVKECCRLARWANKWVHMGRVNSVRRLSYARAIGCQSCDGTGMARFRHTTLKRMLSSLDTQQLFLL